MKRWMLLSCFVLPLACGANNEPSSRNTKQSSEKPTLECGSSALRARSHDICAAMDAKAIPDPEYGSCACMLGFAWDGAACVALGDCFCEGTDCDKLTSDEASCQAAHAQCEGSTGPAVQRISCGDLKRGAANHDVCAAMDAKAMPDPEYGSCACMLGFAWDGSACVALGDCFCEGTDCDKLTLDEAACKEAHAHCG